MTHVRKSLYLATSAFALSIPAAQAEIEIGDMLGVTGFVDMSTVYYDPDGGSSVASSQLDQFELDFLFDFGSGLSAQVDVEYHDDDGDPDGDGVDIEQVFLSYALSSNVNVKAGRFLSYSGWETEEPTGLFQYSGAGYAKYFYGGYQQGVSINYMGEVFDLGVSAVNDLADPENSDSEEIGFEFMGAFHPTENWTVKGFYMVDQLGFADEDIELFNFWTSYSVAGWTLAAEVSSSENAPAAVGIAGLDAEADGYLLMANYAWDQMGLTFRYHDWEVESGSGFTVEEITGYTIAPSYKFSDNLLFVFEFRYDDDDVSGDDSNTFAIEALLTF